MGLWKHREGHRPQTLEGRGFLEQVTSKSDPEDCVGMSREKCEDDHSLLGLRVRKHMTHVRECKSFCV